MPLMQGFPPDPETRVTLANWRTQPYSSWGFHHVREIVPGGLAPPADICVANILIGQLVRPSMVAVLSSNVRPGGLLCLSGVRPDQCGSLREVYSRHFDWEPAMYAEAEPGAEGKAYWGRWSRLVGRRGGVLGRRPPT